MKKLRKTEGKTPLVQRTGVKVTAFILTILMTAVFGASIFATATFAHIGIYNSDENEFLYDNTKGAAFDNLDNLLYQVMVDGENKDFDSQLKYTNIARFSVTYEQARKESNSYKNILDWEREGNYEISTEYHRFYVWNSKKNRIEDAFSERANLTEPKKNNDNVLVTLHYVDPPTVSDNYKRTYDFIRVAYAMRYAMFFVIFASFILMLASFIFLICASGHHKGREKAEKSWGTAFPLDLLAAIVFAPLFIALGMVAPFYRSEDIIPFINFMIGWEILFVGFCMSFALRVKLGKWWRNTVIYKLLRGIIRLIRKIPLVWRTALIISGVFLVELILMVANWSEPYDRMLAVWFVTKLVLFAAVILIAAQLRKLKDGGNAIASGDTDYKIDSSKLFIPDFREHAENLNNISTSVNIAVGERLKSERMKTELITNVSHDIKTPLTSIINYSDLIGREKCDNEKITEYAEVLTRQSERLKRLIEDLVEASKASTGNLEVVLAPLDANILLTQAVGEYGEKLSAANLEIITTEPDEPISINADSRRLWRVFDNLLNNICKYAQSGTRVYLSLEKDGGDAVIAFKNISRAPLNMSADELMERFVRGDESRSTEGNGLGLSIARSLTELQNGTFEIEIDGDLFKVYLRFSLV